VGILAERTIGDELRELRLERGWTLRDVALQVDDEISWQAVSKIERGDREPTTPTLAALARAFGVRFVIDQEGIRLERG
jgi:transcriptional regulator with XRE-family HTH domain